MQTMWLKGIFELFSEETWRKDTCESNDKMMKAVHEGILANDVNIWWYQRDILLNMKRLFMKVNR